jgi:DNA-directed RNA polymerase specialized sigma24 family protein
VVERVIGRRLPAFETFLEANRARVYRYLVTAVGAADADDVFQETFLAALRAVRDLPARQRDAVAYRHVLGLSVSETASLMGTTEETVRANAYQGLKRLKERATWASTKD